MKIQYSGAQWDDFMHRSAFGSKEHAKLEAVEKMTGHMWDRLLSGHIKFFPINYLCQGPVCEKCGFTFCVECGIPDSPIACKPSAAALNSENGLVSIPTEALKAVLARLQALSAMGRLKVRREQKSRDGDGK